MDPRYALFIWSSFGIAAVAVLWNVLSPRFQRNDLMRRLSEHAEDTQGEDE
jgi:heme exporter protein CcmD